MHLINYISKSHDVLKCLFYFRNDPAVEIKAPDWILMPNGSMSDKNTYLNNLNIGKLLIFFKVLDNTNLQINNFEWIDKIPLLVRIVWICITFNWSYFSILRFLKTKRFVIIALVSIYCNK